MLSHQIVEEDVEIVGPSYSGVLFKFSVAGLCLIMHARNMRIVAFLEMSEFMHDDTGDQQCVVLGKGDVADGDSSFFERRLSRMSKQYVRVKHRLQIPGPFIKVYCGRSGRGLKFQIVNKF